MFKGGFKFNGWYKSEFFVKVIEGGVDIMFVELKRLVKGKILIVFRFIMVGNKEFDNFVCSFEL